MEMTERAFPGPLLTAASIGFALFQSAHPMVIARGNQVYVVAREGVRDSAADSAQRREKRVHVFLNFA
jgi:hypothetical protein